MSTQNKQIAIIYYCKSFGEYEITGGKTNSNNFVKVCEYKILRDPNHSDHKVLEAIFELFNWIHEDFQPNDKEIGFSRGEADHTSMSVGDMIELNGIKYICASFGFEKVA